MALSDEQEAAFRADIKDIERNVTEAKESLALIRADSVPFQGGSKLVMIPQEQKDAEELLMRQNFTKIKNKANHAEDI